ncbi:acetyl-CoA carboxylase carboxyl transferase subunit beta [Spongiactinospora rosea]|uniref:Multifunctional fusion protein n=2 Tax=Spongiactinospora rosea TaxID=2248750 RepID=A0A366M2U1_9ACTN|nr:acetyl-CoA carboxylase carboxyl transferase subunit beta [Spongiactinospora rosea]
MTPITGKVRTRHTDVAAWVQCPRCLHLVYGRRLDRNLNVCPECGDHRRMTAVRRLDLLLDPGTGEPLGLPVRGADPLGFVDSKPYPERLRAAREATGLREAVVCRRGAIEGNPVIVAAMDFGFMGGSLGADVGELITRAAETALRERLPLLIVTASGGARMQEGAVSLMQMAKTSQALGQLDEAGVLTIALVTDPTYGGVAASYATLCDVIVAEPGARLGFAGPRVIEQTIKERLPEGFQTAEFLREHGMIDVVCPRAGLRPLLGRLLSIGTRSPVPGTGALDAGAPAPGTITVGAGAPAPDPWRTVREARDVARPTALDYFVRVLDVFEELHGDRLSGDCTAIVGGLGRLDGIPMVVIGQQKGNTLAELNARNFGMPTPSGYRKAARLMRLAAKLGLPVLTLVDTPGAYPGREAEEQGQAVAIAENLRLMAGLPVPIVTVVTGEGGSGGALALAVANRVLICSNAVYSVISPEGCAAILWKDAAAAPRAAAALRLTAGELLALGIVDTIIPEPEGGTAGAPDLAASRLRDAVLGALRELLGLDPTEIVRRRRARFRAFGT